MLMMMLMMMISLLLLLLLVGKPSSADCSNVHRRSSLAVVAGVHNGQ